MYHGSKQSTRRRHSLSSLRQSALSEWPSSPVPTPHQILQIEPGTPYTKTRFNQLVKIYHPDMSDTDSSVSQLPEAVRLERYRLIIAAHNLLSDASNRRLYESHHQGWFHPKSFSGRNEYAAAPAYSETHDTSPSPMRQRPMYMSNATFAIVLVALGMLGAVLQYRRLAFSRRDTKRIELVLQEAIREEIEAWAAVLQGQSKDDRILAFLARRHGVPLQLQHWAMSHGT